MKKNERKSQRAPNQINVDGLSYNGTPVTRRDLERYFSSETNGSEQRREDAVSILAETLQRPITGPMIEKLHMLGVTRPAWISVMTWEDSAPVTSEERVIVFLSALGMNDSEIAEETTIGTKTVRRVLSFKRTQLKISEIQNERLNPKNLFKKIERTLPQAIETAIEIMNDKTVKPAVRLSAAQDFMDRALGKASQTLEIKDSTFRDVLMRIDALAAEEKEKKTIELQKDGDQCQEKEGDKIDSWVAKNQF